MIYDPARDAFLTSASFPSWILNEETCRYEPPFARPADAGLQADGTHHVYQWDEETKSWSKTIIPAP